MPATAQILKKFTSGDEKKSSSGSSSDLISMAMAEATKLFDKSGSSTSGNKQDAVSNQRTVLLESNLLTRFFQVNGAAMTVMKLLVQSKTSGAVGGGSSGGLGGLLSLVSNNSIALGLRLTEMHQASKFAK